MAERRLEPWPVAVIAALALMISASLGFFAIASTHPDAEVVEDAYAVGLRYNDELHARARAEGLGLQVGLITRPEPEGVHAEVALTDAEGRPAAVRAVSLRRVRPAEGGLDAEFVLVRHGDVFRGIVPLPRRGRWHLVVRANVDGERIERSFSVESG